MYEMKARSIVTNASSIWWKTTNRKKLNGNLTSFKDHSMFGYY